MTLDWSDSFRNFDLKAENEIFYSERLFSALLSRFEWTFSWRRSNWEAREPVIALSRHNGAFYFSGMSHNETVEHRLRFPFGAPILTGSAARLEKGCAHYHFPRSWHKECRIFITQKADGVVSCREDNPEIHGASRWIKVNFLKDAELCILAETASESAVRLILAPEVPYVHCENVPLRKVEIAGQSFLRAEKNVSGNILIYW